MKTIFSRDWQAKQLPPAAVPDDCLSVGECGVKIYPADATRDWQETRVIFYFKENAHDTPIEISTIMTGDGQLADASEQNVIAQREIILDPRHSKKLAKYFLKALKIEA
ncbi:hypothetical protein JW998_06230 [candidate division KSB1 bacterium]|nr:hypothetical protein [candidate division KSB1 bacterium]